jgi:hypothetical protein
MLLSPIIAGGDQLKVTPNEPFALAERFCTGPGKPEVVCKLLDFVGEVAAVMPDLLALESDKPHSSTM